MCGCAGIKADQKRVPDPPRVGVTSDCQLPAMGARDRTWVL